LELANIYAAGTAPAQGYKGLGFSTPAGTLRPARQRFYYEQNYKQTANYILEVVAKPSWLGAPTADSTKVRQGGATTPDWFCNDL
jgi:hypothetical protein